MMVQCNEVGQVCERGISNASIEQLAIIPQFCHNCLHVQSLIQCIHVRTAATSCSRVPEDNGMAGHSSAKLTALQGLPVLQSSVKAYEESLSCMAHFRTGRKEPIQNEGTNSLPSPVQGDGRLLVQFAARKLDIRAGPDM